MIKALGLTVLAFFVLVALVGYVAFLVIRGLFRLIFRR